MISAGTLASRAVVFSRCVELSGASHHKNDDTKTRPPLHKDRLPHLSNLDPYRLGLRLPMQLLIENLQGLIYVTAQLAGLMSEQLVRKADRAGSEVAIHLIPREEQLDDLILACGIVETLRAIDFVAKERID